MIIRVIFRNDGPMVCCGDCPSYRSARIELTPEQVEQLKPRFCFTNGSEDYYEEISKCFIEAEEDIQAENARLRKALEGFVKLAHEVSMSGDKPEPGEWEACVEQAGRVLKGGGE